MDEVKSNFPIDISSCCTEDDILKFFDKSFFEARKELKQKGLPYNGSHEKYGYRISSDGNNLFIGSRRGLNPPDERVYIKGNKFAEIIKSLIPLHSEIGGRYFFKRYDDNRYVVFGRNHPNETPKEIFFWWSLKEKIGVLERTIEDDRKEIMQLENVLQGEREKGTVLKKTLEDDRKEKKQLESILENEQKKRRILEKTLQDAREKKRQLDEIIQNEKQKKVFFYKAAMISSLIFSSLIFGAMYSVVQVKDYKIQNLHHQLTQSKEEINKDRGQRLQLESENRELQGKLKFVENKMSQQKTRSQSNIDRYKETIKTLESRNGKLQKDNNRHKKIVEKQKIASDKLNKKNKSDSQLRDKNLLDGISEPLNLKDPFIIPEPLNLKDPFDSISKL